MRNSNDNQDEGSPMSVEDAGRLGGETTLREHGPEFYSKIGKKGGRARGRNRARENRSGNSQRSNSESR